MTTTRESIASLLSVLDQNLFEASAAAKEAHEALQAGDQNIAIAILLPIERQCEDILALLRVVLSLHCRGRDRGIGGAR